MNSGPATSKKFNTSASLKRAKKTQSTQASWKLDLEGKGYRWTNTLERIEISRAGISFTAIDVLSQRMEVPIKEVLHIFGLAQTTYNKKRREKALLNGRDSEMALLLTELIDFGWEVFNQEKDKFQRWMKKSNISLGGNSPEMLLDSVTGIQEVKNCLNRLETGNFA